MILPLLVGYFLGAIPFGLLLARLGGKGDIRAIGSGNIGATNVLRTGSKGLAALTLLLDAAKGAAAVLLAQRLWPDAAIGRRLSVFRTGWRNDLEVIGVTAAVRLTRVRDGTISHFMMP